MSVKQQGGWLGVLLKTLGVLLASGMVVGSYLFMFMVYVLGIYQWTLPTWWIVPFACFLAVGCFSAGYTFRVLTEGQPNEDMLMEVS